MNNINQVDNYVYDLCGTNILVTANQEVSIPGHGFRL